MSGVSVAAWPRGLQEELAAAYVGLSQTSFRSYVMPVVRRIALTPGRFVFLREDLDAWLDSKAGAAPDKSAEPEDFWASLTDAQGQIPLRHQL